MNSNSAISSANGSAAAGFSFSPPLGEKGRGRPLPRRLRQALEHLSGYDLSDTRVHYDSPLPELVGARAFACGTTIYLQTGAAAALPHEAWHVVQQLQGRVQATRSLEVAAQDLGINDQEELEQEADRMGARAARLARSGAPLPSRASLRTGSVGPRVLQLITRVADTNFGYVMLAEFQEGIRKNLPKDVLQVAEFGNITKDILNEDLLFATWQDLAKEIYIREVGYRVEAKMRALMTDHQRRMKIIVTTKQKTEDLLRKEIAAAEEKLETADKSTAEQIDKDIAALNKKLDEAQELANRDVMKFLLFWGEAVPVGNNADGKAQFHFSPMADWLSGATKTLPYRMNCWETVIFSAYLAGVVSRDYIAWCDSNKPTDPALVGACSNILDDYYKCVIDRAVIPFSKTAKGHIGPPGWNSSKSESDPENEKIRKQFPGGNLGYWFVPEKTVIPRGRLLIFYNGAHVAISTGTFIPMKGQIRKLPWNQGHGILETDGDERYTQVDYTQGRLIEEKAMEDLKQIYQRILVIAPFPICDSAGGGSVTVPDPNAVVDEQAVTLQVEKKIEAKYRDIFANINNKIAAQNNQLNAQPPPTEARKKVINSSLVAAQKQLAKAQEQREKEYNLAITNAIMKAKKDLVKTTKNYQWEKFDPYKDKVQFPRLQADRNAYEKHHNDIGIEQGFIVDKQD